MRLKIIFCSAAFIADNAPPNLAHGSVSEPVGYVTISIAGAFSPTVYTITPFFAPLHGNTSIAGKSKGTISAVTSNTISDGSAVWDPNALSTAAAPYFVKVNSGAGVGRMFQITANTSSQMTLNTEGLDLPPIKET